MGRLVLDPSVAAAWCFKDEASDYTEAVLQAVSASEATAPRLWAYEIRNTVLMGVRRNRITRSDARDFLRSLFDLPIFLADPPSYDAVFALADQHNLTY